jgi:hypothetical protein
MRSGGIMEHVTIICDTLTLKVIMPPVYSGLLMIVPFEGSTVTGRCTLGEWFIACLRKLSYSTHSYSLLCPDRLVAAFFVSILRPSCVAQRRHISTLRQLCDHGRVTQYPCRRPCVRFALLQAALSGRRTQTAGPTSTCAQKIF